MPLDAALDESREMLKAIVDATTAVIYVKDLEGRYILINRRFEELFHVSNESAQGRIEAWSAWSRGRRGIMPEAAARRINEEARRIIRMAGSEQGTTRAEDVDPELAGKLLLMAYPDRAARRTAGGAVSRWLLATGRGARLAGDMGNADFLAAAELAGGETDAHIFLAAPITIGDLESGLAGLAGRQ